MTETFDVVVIGKGMMGAAAARYLAEGGHSVALVGPGEPADRRQHEGVFASHYDSGRITRTIDGSGIWAFLARRSIERYGEIEERSGIRFYSEVGCLIVGRSPGGADDSLDRVLEARDALHVHAPLFDRQAMAARFSYFAFDAGLSGVFEPEGAGVIDPRAFVAAEVRLAEMAGATLVDEEAVAVGGEGAGQVVETKSGRRLSCGRVLVAAGGFSQSRRLLARPLALTVKARTVLFAEVSERDLARFAGMPSLIRWSPQQADNYYMLPPVRYPDGRHYIKIGGDPDDVALGNEEAVKAWFRGEGRAETVAHLAQHLRSVLPDFSSVSTHSAPCVTTFSRHGNPYIGWMDEGRVAVVTAGCGASAKSADEIGRLAALMIDGMTEERALNAFIPVFADETTPV
ncbi:sarcosine oxidase [Rhizobium sp. RU20A]|uniref:NAD(P)/FAD-dependent oxidoreductase n=1 Tax=Rhizobium sp. RU20A TaxID=1907412 RepID=UPI00095633BD|nr:FAD-binding oxidoreductase [Rhizobium sp. RU20A]SIQ21294.1 sarcosine oxidase [Rhizobium sp. RU20A]